MRRLNESVAGPTRNVMSSASSGISDSTSRSLRIESSSPIRKEKLFHLADVIAFQHIIRIGPSVHVLTTTSIVFSVWAQRVNQKAVIAKDLV